MGKALYPHGLDKRSAVALKKGLAALRLSLSSNHFPVPTVIAVWSFGFRVCLNSGYFPKPIDAHAFASRCNQQVSSDVPAFPLFGNWLQINPAHDFHE